MIVYAAGPLWVRVMITIGAVVLFAVMAWRYYEHYWRRR